MSYMPSKNEAPFGRQVCSVSREKKVIRCLPPVRAKDETCGEENEVVKVGEE